MNWTRIALAGVAAGVVTWISDFVLHGIVMGPTYQRLSQVYSQTAANPAKFLAVSRRDRASRRRSSSPGAGGAGPRAGREDSPSGSSSASCSSSSASTTPW